ncbi:uncharacterized protein LOC116348042 [Contarinia nasturtii]|uniref:uncharacterized protein LOC116348042 n=1 Tax=Contarinia nasturtii TaxID=265458 RepID=UPI0012D40883|nr:uncharacterized protein LOC116348042 [Contarinia nasturtii]XP_031634753.1 uncharacterized protein LOC116348042 [Contarinia nasturtii]
MENGQTSNCLKWKFTGNALGITFGITFMFYFGFLSMLIEAKLLLAALMIALDLAATINWMFGIMKDKPSYLLVALIVWGIPLIITFSILQKPLKTYVAPFKIHEILIFAVTVHFVLFYFILMMSYRSLKKFAQHKRSESSIDWKIVAIAVGWIILALNIGLTTLFVFWSVVFGKKMVLLITCLVFVINLILTAMWLWGVSIKKTGFMLVSLYWWTMTLIVWLVIIIHGIYNVLSKGQTLYHSHDDYLYVMTVFCIALYFMAVWTYKSLKKSIQKNEEENHRFRVTYTACTENKDFGP